MLRRVALIRNDVSEEPSASFIRVTRIGELGTTQAATNNRRTLRRNMKYVAAQRDEPQANYTLHCQKAVFVQNKGREERPYCP
jgi:hypothetical protein